MDVPHARIIHSQKSVEKFYQEQFILSNFHVTVNDMQRKSEVVPIVEDNRVSWIFHDFALWFLGPEKTLGHKNEGQCNFENWFQAIERPHWPFLLRICGRKFLA